MHRVLDSIVLKDGVVSLLPAQHEIDIREGLHPGTGDFLRPRHSADRLATDVEAESKARSLHDLTLSAPKSGSAQALVGGYDRLFEAHREAVNVALTQAIRDDLK